MPDATEAPTPPPDHECDIVMRGGVTSGIVYPGAIAEIAKLYRLRSVGGTSAGAIAAATAAAMEFGRMTCLNEKSLERLSAVPRQLGEVKNCKTLLLRLFQPDLSTAKLFDMMSTARRTRRVPIIHIAVTLLGVLWPILLCAAVLAAVPFAAICMRAPVTGVWWLERLMLLIGIYASFTLLLLLLPPVRVLLKRRSAAMVDRTFGPVRDNRFGLCSGMESAPDTDSLIEWIHKTLQELAGLPPGQPLTFGHLWLAGEPDRAKGWSTRVDRRNIAADPRAIDLRLIASDLTRSACIEWPFLPPDHRLYARLDDLRALFPRDVVAWIERTARLTRLGKVDPAVDQAAYVRLPLPQDLPVLLAVRMSMSFPFLLSAVPLHLLRSIDRKHEELIELWIADGGITTNFPIHMFDSPVPTRPTFCLNLTSSAETVEQGPTKEEGGRAIGSGTEALVFMPTSNHGTMSSLRPFVARDSISDLSDFALRILGTARSWGDNLMVDAPGYRDRIVHIAMCKGEGGLALDMPSDALARLDRRGRAAGKAIAERFLPGQTDDPLNPGKPLRLNWSNHRFVRLRSYLAGFEIAMARFAAGWTSDLTEAPPLDAILAASGTSSEAVLPQKVGYRIRNKAQRRLARKMIANIAALAELPTKKVSMDHVGGRHSSPRPKPLLRMRPAIDADPAAQRGP